MSKKIAMERIQRVRKEGSLKRFDYREITPGIGDSGVFCKCGNRIQGLQPVPWLSTTERRGSVTIIKERVALIVNSAYTEIEITFDDSSKHVTPVCRTCVRRGFPNDVLNAIYTADMNRWDEEDRLGMGSVAWGIVGSREAVSWREVTDQERTSG